MVIEIANNSTLSSLNSYSGTIGSFTAIIMIAIIITIILIIIWHKTFGYGLIPMLILLISYLISKWVATQEIEVAQGGGYYVGWAWKVILFFVISALLGQVMKRFGLIAKIKKA